MIYLFAGDDSNKKIAAYEKFLKDQGDAEVFKLSRNDLAVVELENFYGGGLFFKKSVVAFSDVLGYEETREAILDKLPQMAASANDFVFLDGKLPKAVLDAFKKSRAEINVYEEKKAKEEKFNSFLLANALGAKDKLDLWVYFRQAMKNGVELDPLAGILFWKAKDMLLKKNFSKFTEEELKNLVKKISFILPEARSKNQDAEVAFERFILEAF